MMRMLLLSCLALTLVTVDASAQWVVGAGGDKCGTWIKERRERNVMGYAQTTGWVLGYLRGYFDGQRRNKDSGDMKDPLLTIKGGAVDAVEGWLDKYCAEQPLNSIYAASQVLAVELIARSR